MVSLKKNVIYHVIYQVLLLIIPLVTIPYVSRIIGVDGVGAYSYIHSIVQYFMLFIILGLNNYGNRTVAKKRNNKEELRKAFWSIYIMQLLSALIVTLAFCVFLIVSDTRYISLFIIDSLFIVSSCLDINWLFFGLEKFRTIVVRNIIIRLVSLIAIFIFVKTESDLNIYALILACSSLLTNVVLWPYVFKRIPFMRPDKRSIMSHFKSNLVLFIPVVAISVYNIMDKIMIGSFIDVHQVGLYENSERIINVPLNILTAFGTVMMPRISNLVSEKRTGEVKKLIKKSFDISMLLAFPMTFMLIGIADDLVLWYLGDSFLEAGVYVQLLSVIVVLKVWANVIRTQYLIPHELDKPYIKSVVFGAIINFVLNVVLIKMIGAIGAVIGTIATELFVAVYQTIAIRDKLPFVQYLRRAVVFGIKGVAMLIAVLMVGALVPFTNTIIKLIVQVLFGFALYALLNLKDIAGFLNKKNDS